MYTIPRDRLYILRKKAVSQKNFAVLCMRELFTEEERVGSTVTDKYSYAGRKRRLDPTGRRLQLIYNYVMQMYNVPVEDRQTVWEDCKLGFYSANVYLKRTINETNVIMSNLVDTTHQAVPSFLVHRSKSNNY